MTDKPRFSLTVTEDMLARIEDFQKKHGLSTRNKAIQRLVEIAIQEIAAQNGALPGPVDTSAFSDEALDVAAAYDTLDTVQEKNLVRKMLGLDSVSESGQAKTG